MTLHEKGRAAIKRKEITKALLLLLEADKEFRYESLFSDNRFMNKTFQSVTPSSDITDIT